MSDTKHMRAIMARLQERGFGAADAASALDVMVELGLYPVTAAEKAVLDAMSYSLYIETRPCRTCGRIERYLVGDVTLHLSPIVDAMLDGSAAPRASAVNMAGIDAPSTYSWPRLHGHSAAVVGRVMSRGRQFLKEHWSELETIEPTNGWGSLEQLESLVETLVQRLVAVDETAIFEVTYG